MVINFGPIPISMAIFVVRKNQHGCREANDGHTIYVCMSYSILANLTKLYSSIGLFFNKYTQFARKTVAPFVMLL